MAVPSAVRRTIELAPILIQRSKRAAFAGDEGITRESLRQHAIETDLGAIRFVAAQQREHIPHAIERIDALRRRPERWLRVGAFHPHAKSAMVLDVLEHGGFIPAARTKHFETKNEIYHQIPIVPHPRRAKRSIWTFLAEQGDRDEGGLNIRKDASFDGCEDI